MSQLTHSKVNELLLLEDLRMQWKKQSDILNQNKQLTNQFEATQETERKLSKQCDNLCSQNEKLNQELKRAQSTVLEGKEKLLELKKLCKDTENLVQSCMQYSYSGTLLRFCIYIIGTC